MTMSGSFGISTDNQYISGHLDWSASNNISANTSDVTVNMYLSRTNSGYTSYGSGTFTIWVNGQAMSNTLTYSITQNSNTWMVGGTIYGIGHNADGTLNITISWSGSGSSGFTINGSTSGNATLDTIPRASTFASTTSWTADGSNLSMSLNVASSSFHHTIQIFVADTSGAPNPYGNPIGERTNIGSSTTWVFTQAEMTLIYQKNNMYESRPTIIRVITYDQNGTQIGNWQDATGNVYAIPTGTFGNWGNYNIGNDLTGIINNYYSNFTYNITMTFGSFTKTWNNVCAGSSSNAVTLTFTTTDVNSLYAQIPNVNSGTATFTTRTLYNGIYTEDGIPSGHDTTATLNVVNSNPSFTVNGVTYYDTNSNTNTLKGAGNEAYIIQNQSTVQVKIPVANKALAVNGASMSSYTITLNGITKTATYSSTVDVAVDFGTVNSSSNVTLTVKAIDSRGNSTSQSKTVTMIPYSPPVVTAKATRLNNFENTTTLTLTGSISQVIINSVAKNSLDATNKVQYRYKDASTSTWSSWINFTFTTSGANYTASYVTLDLGNLQSWNIDIQVIDKLTTKTVSLIVGVGQPILFIDPNKKSVGVNQFPQYNNSFEVANDIYEGGNTLKDKYAPSGIIQMFGGSTPPSGWLLCQGQAISRTTYSRLFSIIGTTYGSGDGSTTFNLPNLQGKVPVGLDSNQTEFNTLGETGGEKTHTLSLNESPQHSHIIHEDGGYTVGRFGGVEPNLRKGYQYQGDGNATTFYTDNQGGGQAHNNLQPYITVNYIIRV